MIVSASVYPSSKVMDNESFFADPNASIEMPVDAHTAWMASIWAVN